MGSRTENCECGKAFLAHPCVKHNFTKGTNVWESWLSKKPSVDALPNDIYPAFSLKSRNKIFAITYQHDTWALAIAENK